MDCAGRQQVQPGMQMLVVVPVHEFNDETFRVLDAHEVFRINYAAFHRRKDAFGKGATYDELREQYILFLCPTDIFGAGKAIYRFENREESNPNILLGDLTYKNFYIFKKYSEVEDESTREYMQYFATQKCESEKMKRIQAIVDKYRKDPITRKAYMTLEQELNIKFKKGRAEGRAEANKEIAKGLRDDGVSLEIISKRTGLPPEEIKAL